MKRSILGLCALGLLACGSDKCGGSSQPLVIASGSYAATRWIPGTATYAVATPTVRDAQQNVRDLIETAGLIGGHSSNEVSRNLERILLVDPLSPDAVSAIGVDLEGGFAMFSEALNPTIVVRLASEPTFHHWIDQQNRERTQSQVVDGVEVFTVPVPAQSLRVSWAVADGWLWLHLALPNTPDDGARWFTASRRPGAPTWTADFESARG